MVLTLPIQNKNSVAELIEDDIVYIKYLADTYLEIEDFKEGIDAYQTLAEGRTLKVLIEMGKHTSFSTQAREYAEQNKVPAVAEDIVFDSLPIRILFNFYTKFRTLDHPIKGFKSFDDALGWLRTL